MKRLISVVLMAMLVLTGCSGTPEKVQEDTGPKAIYKLYLDLKSETNLIFSTYDVEVIMDDQEIGTIPNGKTFSKVLELEEGSHTLKIAKAGDSSVNARKNIDVNGDMSFRCTIAHGSSIDLKDIETKAGTDDSAITVPDLTGMVLADAEATLKEAGFDNIKSEGVGGSVWMSENWLVTSQNVEKGTQTDRHNEIVLECIKLDEYYNGLFTGKTVAEVEDMTASAWYSVTYEDDSYHDMNDQVASMDAETKAAWTVVSARQYGGADKTAKLYIENPEQKAAEEAAEAEESAKAADDGVSKEYKNALKSAKSYAKYMNMSKAAIFDQLTSEYGDKFPEDAAQYAIDHVEADWNENALKSAESYAKHMHMSKAAIYDQLISEYGDQFTETQAQYAIDHIEADWNQNALESAKSYQEYMNMSKSAIYDQLISEYGDQFTESEAQYAIDHLD